MAIERRSVVALDHAEVRGWGLTGNTAGFLWVQDFALEGAPIEAQTADDRLRTGVVVDRRGWPSGDWVAVPYDTWTGAWLAPTSP